MRSKIKAAGKINLPMFGWLVNVYVGKNIAVLYGQVLPGEHPSEGTSIDYKALHVHGGEVKGSILLLPPDACAGMVAHECFHVVDRCLASIGATYGEQSVEIYTHLLQWLTNQVFDIIDRHNK